MLVSINGKDITKHISEKSYKMNSEPIYESWLDGNYKEHRIYTRTRVKGSFTICLYGSDGVGTAEFLENWNKAVSNNVATMAVFVQNENKMEAINAYFTFEGTFHREMLNGDYCDKLNVTIYER